MKRFTHSTPREIPCTRFYFPREFFQVSISSTNHMLFFSNQATLECPWEPMYCVESSNNYYESLFSPKSFFRQEIVSVQSKFYMHHTTGVPNRSFSFFPWDFLASCKFASTENPCNVPRLQGSTTRSPKLRAVRFLFIISNSNSQNQFGYSLLPSKLSMQFQNNSLALLLRTG